MIDTKSSSTLNNMTEAQAIQSALALLQSHSLGRLTDLTAPKARFVIPSESMKETYAKFPLMIPKGKEYDYWEITFPYFKEDVLGRTDIAVIVYPHSGKSKLLMG